MGADQRTGASLPAPFRRLRAAAWVSNFGDGVRNAALPLLAAGIDGQATTVAVVAAAGTVPFAIGGLAAGTMADRRRRVPLVATAHGFRAVVAVALAGAALADTVTTPLLVFLAFLLGCGEAVADSASPALVPDLVGGDDLEAANASLETAELVANDLVGPPVGGGLLALAPWAPFLVDGVSFLAAGAVVRSIDVAEEVPDAPTTSWWADAREGARVSWTNPVLRATGLLIVTTQLGLVAAFAPIVVYLTEDLGLSAAAYGVFLAVGSLGGLAGARAVPRLVLRFGSRRTLVASLMGLTAGIAVLVVPAVPVVALGTAVSFATLVVARIVVVTARQRAVPGRLLGRAQGAIRSLLWAAATVGALAGGVLADAVSPQAPFVFGAASVALATIVLRRPLRAVLDHAPTAAVDGPASPGAGSDTTVGTIGPTRGPDGTGTHADAATSPEPHRGEVSVIDLRDGDAVSAPGVPGSSRAGAPVRRRPLRRGDVLRPGR